jgi:hypothetical protein
VIHHLNGPGKAAPFRELHATLAPDGELSICDLAEQFQWLAEAGFTGVDVFRARAGHALFGGCKKNR